MNEVAVAIVGGGPAGAALATRLAQQGIETVLFERLPAPRWRASGVYSSPLTRRRLEALGLPPNDVERLIRPISAMHVQSADGRAACRLEYSAPDHACGLDRVRMERTLLDHARRAGAQILEGHTAVAVDLSPENPRLVVSGPSGASHWQARLVVGADGPPSLVARSAGVALPSRHFRRGALTVHRADPDAGPRASAMVAEMIVGAGWYCGIAPVPGARVNLGLVLSERELRRQLQLPGRRSGIFARTLAELPGDERAWASAPATDEIQVALPLLHRVEHAAGRGFVLVGDAAGFVDPLSGDGLQRAFASAELAATAIGRALGGEGGALADYDRRLRARFRSKDVLSWLLQGFLANPVLARHALRRLERRAELRRTFSLALADLVPASRVMDPVFLSRLLAP